MAKATVVLPPEAEARISLSTEDISTDTLSTQDPESGRALQWALCTPTAIAAFTNRIHVRCSVPISGIYFFAARTSDTGFATRVLAVLTSAYLLGRDLYIQYDPADTSGAAIGCAASDCRLLVAAEAL